MHAEMKASPVLLFGETLLWERDPVFSLLAANNKPFLLLILAWMCLLVPHPLTGEPRFWVTPPSLSLPSSHSVQRQLTKHNVDFLGPWNIIAHPWCDTPKTTLTSSANCNLWAPGTTLRVHSSPCGPRELCQAADVIVMVHYRERAQSKIG